MKLKGSDTGTLPLRPAKKQKVSSIETSLPIYGTNLETPCRSGSNTNNSRWVTPSVTRKQHQGGETHTRTEFGSSLELSPPLPLSTKENGMASNKKSIQQDKPNTISQAQKENLPNRNLAPRGSVKEKSREKLKAILLHNGQNVTGSVKVLQTRVADGEAYGKLGLCPRCHGGKLKIFTENPEFVYCSRKAHCGFQCSTHNAPRAGPWTCVSFDDDEDATTSPNDAGSLIVTTRSTNIGSSTTRLPSPPLPYWNGQYPAHPILPSPPQTTQNGFVPPAPYPLYYPPQFGFPHHQALHPLHMGYRPLQPPPQVLQPPNNYRDPRRTPNSDGVNQNRDTMPHEKRWFPLPNPASFPDRVAASLQRPPASNHVTAGKIETHKVNPNVCNYTYTSAEVARATEAAKNVLEARQSDGKWSAEEDEIVRDAVTSSNPSHFNAWKSLVPFLPGRKGKQIRDRWVNHLNPLLLHTPFGKDEDLSLWKAVAKFGTSWKEISVRQFYSKRSENAVKNRWHSAPFQRFIADTFGPKAYAKAIAKVKQGSSDC